MRTGAIMGDSGPSLNAGFRFKFFNPSADEPNGVWEASLTQGGFVAVNSIDGAKHVANLSIKF